MKQNMQIQLYTQGNQIMILNVDNDTTFRKIVQQMKEENIIKITDQPKFYLKQDLKKQIPLNDLLLPIVQSGITEFQMQMQNIEIDDNQVYGITLSLIDKNQKLFCNVKPLDTFYQLVRSLYNENLFKQTQQIQFQTLEFEKITLDQTIKQYLLKEQTEFILIESNSLVQDEIRDVRIQLLFILKEGQNPLRVAHFFNPDSQIQSIHEFAIQAYGIRSDTQVVQLSYEQNNLDQKVFHKTLKELNIKTGQIIDVKITSIAGSVLIQFI